MLLSSSSPVAGILALCFLLAVSIGAVLAVTVIRRLIREIKDLKSQPPRAEEQPKPKKTRTAVKGSKCLTIKPQDIKSISFKDDVA